MNGIEILIPILAVAGFWAAIIILVYMFFSSRHRERMALIDNRMDAKIFSTGGRREDALKIGIVSIMAGLGVLIGYMLDRSGLPGAVSYTVTVLLFGGAGLVGFYYLIRQSSEKEVREKEEIL